jgi:transmembrane sensor
VAGISLVALLSVSAVLVFQTRFAPAGEQRYITAVGDRKDLTLADGSRVTLNTRTTARAAVTAQQRLFWLDQGEAFFDVRPDPRHPFVITAGHERMTVLGTKFSVRYEQGRTQVNVVEGRVKLEKVGTQKGRVGPESATLAPNQVAIAQAESVVVAAITPEQAQRELAWRKGIIEFENQPLADVATEFNRYSRRQLVVVGDAANLKLSGRLANDNVDAFVRMIHTGFGVVAREREGKIYLSMK